MSKAIRDHLRDFLAILGLLLVALVATYIIVQNQRLRIPLLEEKPFELKAEMTTAQAVTPGQGQTVRVAGVRVGDISSVDYENGHAVVTMAIDRKFLPVYKDATVLLRPKTGLKDMFLELDPGTDYDPNSNDDEFQNGDEISLANTAPDTNIDQILSALDGDTRAYLRLLLTQGGEGLNGRGKDLGKLLGSLGPINRGLARINTEVAKRKENLARLVHNMNLLFGTVGQDGEGIEQLVSASDQALGAIASQAPDVQRTVSLLGPTLRTTRVALEKTDALATELGPAIASLRPFARKLKPVNDSLANLAQTTYDPVKDDIRPFVRNARQPVRDLRPAAKNLVAATPRLTTVGEKLNKLFNMAAYNPNGAESPGTSGRDEGYLYWLGWLGHVGNSTFSSQDAHGVYRHVYVVATCNTVKSIVATSPLAPVITGRKKDIIITAGGKNITPANLEAEIKQSPYVSQCVVIGDRRPYLIALITLDPEECAKLAQERGWPADPAELARHEGMRQLIQEHIDEVNQKFARVEQVKKFEILPHDLSQETGELTPTMKVKRNVVADKYEEQVEALYA
jgi:phospholipid/cholesterol/gamma-HCH transport system substrate-binding protein